MADFELSNSEFLLIDECVDQLPGVSVKQSHQTRKRSNKQQIPTLVKAEHIQRLTFPILCIKLGLQDGSSFVYIPQQTIIANPRDNSLFIHKLGVMGESDLIDCQGALMIPEWCLQW